MKNTTFLRHARTLFLSLLFPASSYALWQLPVQNFSPRDYSAGTQNWRIAEQQNGWIYAANNFGVLEYDGSDWHLYGIWGGTSVRAIAIDKQGCVYAGGTNEFGYFKAQTDGSLLYQSISINLPKEYQGFGEVWNMYFVNDDLYVQARQHVFRVKPSGDIELVTTQDYIYCSASIRNGLYLASTDGIFFLTGSQLHSLTGSDRLRQKRISGIYAYRDNDILIATEHDGIFIYDGEAVQPMHTVADSYIKQNQLFALAVSDNQIAYGTVQGGIVLTDITGSSMRIISKQQSLQNQTVLSLLYSTDGTLWAGLDSGIDHIAASAAVTDFTAKDLSIGSGYTSITLGNQLYLGTNQGVYALRQGSTDLRLLHNSQGQVWSLDTLGTDIFCSHHSGLYLIQNEVLKPLSEDDGFWRIRRLSNTTAVAGSYRGFYLMRRDGNTWRIVRKIQGFERTTYQFETDNQNNIYVATSNGLIRLTLNSAQDSFTADTLYIPQDATDYVSIARLDKQLIISSAHYCKRVSEDGSVLDDDAFFALLDGKRHYPLIAQDAAGNLFYLYNNTLKLRTVSPTDPSAYEPPITLIHNDYFFIGGFPSIQFESPQDVIVGGVTGYCRIDLEAATHQRDQQPIKPHIRRMVITSSHDSLVYGQTYPAQVVTPTLRYKDNSIRFEYGCSPRVPHDALYSTRLKGQDAAFSDYTNATQKEYTDLHEGNYTFIVRMLRQDSGEVSQTEVSFRILPPWYRTWWAWIIWVALAGLFCWFITLNIRLKVRHDKEKIAQENERKMLEQENLHRQAVHEQEKKILQLENEKTTYELRNKSQELSNLLLNQVNRNELIQDIQEDLHRVADDLKDKSYQSATKRIQQLQTKLSQNAQEIDWKRFEENFDMVNDKFIQRLSARYPWLNKNERKLCVYIRMGLYTKEIAPLLNLSTRGVEMLRYRMRKKMELDRDANLEQFFKQLGDEQ